MTNPGLAFVQEFVVGLGFLNGLWIHVGLSPEGAVLDAFSQVLVPLMPESAILFWLVPLIVTALAVFGAWTMGGPIGLAGVGLAFLGGIFISSGVGVFLLIVGAIVGFAAGLMGGD